MRLGLLIGGLVIIAALSTQAYTQRTFSSEDAAAVSQIDQIVNYLLFSLLGILVVRDTGLLYSGILAGVFAALLDAIVVAAASLMAPPTIPMSVVEEVFLSNLAIGTVFAGLAGVVYGLAQRWTGGRRSR